ncbi:hypothetical protein [Winogradskyella sp. UBA3174]|uniref:hypothetical protein n=1 Tax=Winogradskyella sp. UBA3174 TaxID=1947785 RepID=UPI0025D62B55|nr:hypothetical protein [Winogradskyella sp. UBA3174]|tara:strand:+ start:23074 stop:23310 length:237 start_codon:yes stop_codon:yes gene_type:complete
MKTETKAKLYYFGIFFVVYVIMWAIIHYIFSDLDTTYVSGISVFLGVLLSPQKQIIKKQSGNQTQLKWLFSKKVIIIK